MMPFLPGSFGTDGHLQALTAGTVTSSIGGIAYVGRQPKISTSADVASDVIIGGFRVSANGLLRVTDATSALPAGTFLNGGIRVTATGRMCVAIADVGADIAIVNGVACTNDGRVYTSTVAGPVNSVLPVITGTTAGSSSSVSTGTWSGSPAFGYRWFLDGVAIDGEIASTIDTDESWAGQTLSAVVWVTNDGGTGNAEAAGVVLTEGSAYTGPLDLVAANWLLAVSPIRALSAAWLGQQAITITRATDDTSQNYSPDAVTGLYPAATMRTFINDGSDTFNKTASITDESDTLLIADLSGIEIGARVTGTGIQDNSFVGYAADGEVYITNPATVTNASATITFTKVGYASAIKDQSGEANDLSPKASSISPYAWLNDQLGSLGSFSLGDDTGDVAGYVTAGNVTIPGEFTLLFVFEGVVGFGSPPFIGINGVSVDPSGMYLNAPTNIRSQMFVVDPEANWDAQAPYAGDIAAKHLFTVRSEKGTFDVRVDGVALTPETLSNVGTFGNITNLLALFCSDAAAGISHTVGHVGDVLLAGECLSAGQVATLSAELQAFWSTPALP